MLLILWFARLSVGGGDPGEANDGAAAEPADDEPADDEQAAKERRVVLQQLYVGAFLVVAGALIAVFALKWFNGQKGFALAIGTAVIGVGAAMIPPGAAAGAHERATQRAEALGKRGKPKGTSPPTPKNRDGKTGHRKQGLQRRRK